MSKRSKKYLWAGSALFIVANMYSVRELLAVEFLFGLFVGALLLVGFVFYLAQQAGEVSLSWAKPVVRTLAQTVRGSAFDSQNSAETIP
jgi:hypothetical protein